MLHTKFQGNRSSGSEKKIFYPFLPLMGMALILVIDKYINYLSPFARRLGHEI